MSNVNKKFELLILTDFHDPRIHIRVEDHDSSHGASC